MGCSPCKTGASSLRYKITIQKPDRVSDGQGGAAVTFSLFAKVSAEIKPVSARERFFAGRREVNVTHKMRIRFLAGVTGDMQIVFDGRIFQIHGFFDPDERKRWLMIEVEEGVAA